MITITTNYLTISIPIPTPEVTQLLGLVVLGGVLAGAAAFVFIKAWSRKLSIDRRRLGQPIHPGAEQ